MYSVIMIFLFLKISLTYSQDDIFFRDESLELGSPCMKSLGSGVCVFAEQCGISNEMITRGQPPICFFHEHRTPVLCCPTKSLTDSTSNPVTVEKPMTSSPEETTVSSPPPTSTKSPESLDLTASERPLRLSEMKCKEYTQNYTTQKKNFYGIVQGEFAAPGEFPHMAAIGADNPAGDGTTYYCGGSLISERYILTAAHCLTQNSPNVIRLGENDISSDEDNDVVQDYGIEKIFFHPDYRSTSVYNDIALIKLNATVKFALTVRPACLNTLQDPSEKFLTAIGWGHTEFGGVKSARLQKVTLEAFSYDQCSTHYKPGRKMSEGLRPDTQICAGSTTSMKDTCQGDSGGPLSYFKYFDEIRVNMYHVVGVTSCGQGCGFQIPAIYTRVYSYLDWIESIAWN